MDKDEIKNLIKELIEKTTIQVNEISITENSPKGLWFSVEVAEPHFFTNREGEALHALNLLIRKITESKMSSAGKGKEDNSFGVLVDINSFQKRHIENIQAIAHMMAERARYFKSRIEIDPMSAFERRIVHEFLSNETDLETESEGTGSARRVVIKYIGTI